jgi:hypothetical protein
VSGVSVLPRCVPEAGVLSLPVRSPAGWGRVQIFHVGLLCQVSVFCRDVCQKLECCPYLFGPS